MSKSLCRHHSLNFHSHSDQLNRPLKPIQCNTTRRVRVIIKARNNAERREVKMRERENRKTNKQTKKFNQF